jgi:fibronectin type 3 domain-containing protein
MTKALYLLGLSKPGWTNVAEKNSRKFFLGKAILRRTAAFLGVATIFPTLLFAQTSGPTAPGNLTAVPVSENEITLNWTAATDSSGIASYNVNRCRGLTCTRFTGLASVSATTYNDTGLSAGVSFTYEVQAVDENGNAGPYSNVASATTDTPPTAPSNLVASAVSSTQISLSWTAATSSVGLGSYIIQRCKGANCTTFARIGTSGPQSTTYLDSRLIANTVYQYRVRAQDTAGKDGPFSNVSGATTQPTQVQAPVITSSTTASGTVGTAFAYQITATNSPTSYNATGLPPGLNVNTSSGIISGTPTASGSSTVTLAATNSSGTGNATLTITVAVGAPVITSGTTANGTVGAAFSYQITATNSPTSYSATGLPAGLSVNTTSGLVSGTPTAAGSSKVTLGATNSSGTGTATLTITIAAAAGAPVITSGTTASGAVGSAFSYQITATNSPTSYNATGLPAGLSVNTTSGAISGTPSATGSSTVTLSATNSTGTGNATLTITIAAGAQISATPSSVSFGTVTMGNTDSQSITLKNSGSATLTFSQINVTGNGFNQNGLSTSTTIAAGRSATFSATFNPPSSGAQSGSIMLTTNGTPSPLTISLSGTGQTASLLLGSNPTSLAFGNVTDDTTSSKTTSLTNSGNSSVTISGVTATGAGFSASGVPGGTVLTAGQSTTLTVTFAPTSGGAVSGANVSVASNATNSPAVITLTGTGAHCVALSWTASPTGGVTYNVFRGTSSGEEGTTPINSAAVTQTAYTDTSVSPGQTYYYTVEAVDSGGSSTPTNEIVAAIPNP